MSTILEILNLFRDLLKGEEHSHPFWWRLLAAFWGSWVFHGALLVLRFIMMSAQRDSLRARIVLLAAQGHRNDQIQARLGVSKSVVIKWRRRFSQARLAGLADAHGRGRKPTYDAVIRHRIAATACTPPPPGTGTHWSIRTLARHMGVSASLVHSVVHAWEDGFKGHPVAEYRGLPAACLRSRSNGSTSDQTASEMRIHNTMIVLRKRLSVENLSLSLEFVDTT